MQGNKMFFCELRQGLVSIQGLLELNENKEGKPLVRRYYDPILRLISQAMSYTGVKADDQIRRGHCLGVHRAHRRYNYGVEKDVEATTIKKFEVHIAKVRTARRAYTWHFVCLTVSRYGQ
jgi:hypothetical protein